MKQQIKDLAEKAMGTRKHVPPVWQFYDYELEKLYELILQDVLYVVAGHALSNDSAIDVFANLKKIYEIPSVNDERKN